MKDTNRTPMKQWTIKKALILSVVCLVGGIAGGWSIRGLQGVAVTGSAKAASIAPPLERGAVPTAQVEQGTAPAAQAPSPARLKEMADAQAAPLLEKLKSNPNRPDLLAGIGNLYYDAQQYPVAIDYYGRALNVMPTDANVRTDMGTAYWFTGNADAAIAQFNQALKDAPNNPNTLFNRGLVKWKGKMDAAGAIADWQKLLAINPTYAGKDQVEQMMAEAKNHAAAAPGTKTR
jgi:tetratricopeptide (TPR) repeat protein